MGSNIPSHTQSSLEALRISLVAYFVAYQPTFEPLGLDCPTLHFCGPHKGPKVTLQACLVDRFNTSAYFSFNSLFVLIVGCF